MKDEMKIENTGKPMTSEERRAQRDKNLFDDDKALEEYQNEVEMGWDVGGFLRRSNPTTRN